MSTATVNTPRPSVPPPTAGPKLSAGEELIAATIAEAQAALWRAELSRLLLKFVIATLGALIAWAMVDQWIWSPGPAVRLIVLVSGISAALWWFTTRLVPLLRARIRADYAAQSLEHDLPELRHALTSYVSLRGDVDVNGPRGAVVRSIGARAAGQMKQHHVDVPSEAAGTFTWWMAMAAMLAIVAAYSLLSPKNTLQSAQRLLLPLANIDAPTRVAISDVQPGDCETLADRPVEISATIEGLSHRDEPSIQYGRGFGQQEMLRFDASTGRFTANLRVPRSTHYRIAAGDALAGPFEIIAQDVPVASVQSVHIAPPRYTALAPRQSTGGAVTAEENSRVTITATINRPVQRARLELNPRKNAQRTGPSAGSVDMEIAPDGLTATATIPLRLPREKHASVAIDSYHVRVWDTDGNENPDPIVYPVRVIPDLSPEITVVAPREVAKEVPINSQQLFEIGALDPDYGLRRIELKLQRGADPPTTEILWSSDAAVRGNQIAEYRFRPQTLGLRVGDQVIITAVAVDNRENLAEQPEPNRSETQPIELLIVAAQQLPPVNAPEDGLSEPDDEPANRAAPQESDPDGGGDEQADGQAGGAGGDGEAAEGQQSGAGGTSGPSDAQPDDEASPEPGGRDDGPGQQDAGNGQEGQRGESAAGSADDGGDRSADGSGSETTKSTDAPRNADASEAADSQGDGTAEPSAGESSPAGQQAPEGRSPTDAGSGEQDPATATGEPDTDVQGPSGTDSDPSDATGVSEQSDSMSETPAGEGAGADSQDGRQGETGTSDDGSAPRDADTPEPSDAAPPQHDGDAFERIRDYLNQKRSEPPRQSPPTPPGQADPAGGQSDSGDGGAAADSANGDDQGQTPAESGEPSGSDPAGSNAADANGAAGTDDSAPADPSDATGDSGATGDRADPAGADGDPGRDGEPGGDDAGEPSRGDSPRDSDTDAASDPTGTPEADDATADQPRDSAAPESSEAGSDDFPSGQPQPSGGQDASALPRASDSDSGDGQGQASGSDGGEASDLGGEGGQGAADHSRPPDPVDVEHARQATDLVLDYLDQNRDTPDPELLERLNWTPEELRDFTDRWQQLLKSQDDPAAAGGDAQQVEEALRSLGIRQQAEGPIGDKRGRDDAMRGLRDGGNRPPAPTLYRDAFEAFRRGVNRP